jgi:hypothetical protein
VETDKQEQPFIVSREKFEKWVDDRDLRMDKMTDLLLNWDYYYESELAIKDLYDYIIIRQGSQNFDTDTLLVHMLKQN